MMLDDIFETAIPWGGFLAVGALLGASFPDETRDLARRAAILGLRLADKAREIGAESWERGQDIIAEAQAERETERREDDAVAATRLTVVEGEAGPRRRAPSARPRKTSGTSADGHRPAARRPVRRPGTDPQN